MKITKASYGPANAQFDFFESHYGVRRGHSWRSHKVEAFVDLLFDIPYALATTRNRIATQAAQLLVRRILIASVQVPRRRACLDKVIFELKQTKNEITVALAPLGDRGKFHNINMALESYDLSTYDWIIIFDDDIALPPGFLDSFLFLSESAGLKLSQPAHKFRSYYMFNDTHRQFGSMVRKTHFVESGPLTAFYRDLIPLTFPLPQTRWSWGIDVHWAEIARKANMPIGVVDATPLRHLRPVANAYSMTEAIKEGRTYLDLQNVARRKEDILCTVETVHIPL